MTVAVSAQEQAHEAELARIRTSRAEEYATRAEQLNPHWGVEPDAELIRLGKVQRAKDAAARLTAELSRLKREQRTGEREIYDQHGALLGTAPSTFVSDLHGVPLAELERHLTVLQVTCERLKAPRDEDELGQVLATWRELGRAQGLVVGVRFSRDVLLPRRIREVRDELARVQAELRTLGVVTTPAEAARPDPAQAVPPPSVAAANTPTPEPGMTAW